MTTATQRRRLVTKVTLAIKIKNGTQRHYIVEKMILVLKIKK